MAEYIFNTDFLHTTDFSQVIALNSTDSLFVQQGVSVVTRGIGSVVIKTGGTNGIFINGEIYAANNVTINGIGFNNHSIHVGAQGSIIGSVAMQLGSNNRINNDGFIGGAIRLFDGGNLIVNTGTISAITSNLIYGAIQLEGGATGQQNTILNTGMIASDGITLQGNEANDVITNNGIMAGIINLNGGDDTFDSRQGSFVGRVTSGNGDDKVLLGSGDHIIDGGAGGDQMDGGAGFDYVSYQSSGSGLTVNLGNPFANTGDANGDTYTGIEGLIGSGFADILNGDSGSNIIQGGTGIDVMTGATGNDQYYVDNTSDRVIELPGGGTDRVYTSVTYSLIAGSEVEVLLTMGSSTTTNINLTGNQFDNIIGGNAGVNLLRGLTGNDTLMGAAGNDTLWGNLGNDMLLGGLNADTFVFDSALNASTNVDRINDYVVADDRIVLENSIFTGITTAAGSVLSAAEFRVGVSAGDASDRIIYSSGTGTLFYDPDGTGAAAQVQFAVLPLGLAMTQSEFVIA